ncbi:MAG: class II aldolase/adducin family protein [Sphaerochaetaceae bacterium]|jgi:L-fuculose-phosphate aldolase|nr:class II aldolase/adducin family protein [Sphaerochaetaceae bacterium]
MCEISNLQLKCKPYAQIVAQFMNRLYRMGLTSTSGGNISLRINEDLIAITPSQTDKGNIEWDQIALLSIQGENLTPSMKLSIESEMHRLIMIKRPDVNAVVHAHPCTASLLSASDLDVDASFLAEHYAILDKVVRIPYALMGTKALAEAVSEGLIGANAGLLENHGAIAVGPSMLKAFDRLELLENAAKLTVNAAMLRACGIAVQPLTQQRKDEIDGTWKKS